VIAVNQDQRALNELLQLLNQGQAQERQQMVPRQERNEYQILDDDIISNNEIAPYITNGSEIDLNTVRNLSKPHIFWQ
jgi:hypothetical protein